MLILALLLQALVAVGSLAAPSPDRREPTRITRREEFIKRSTSPGAFHSSNWAGAVISDPTAQWTLVSGEFVIPTIVAPVGLRTAYISVWVGIDGYTCNTATLKTGVDIEIKNGVASYFAWREYNPSNYSVSTDGVPFSAGDAIQLTVEVFPNSFLQTQVFDFTQRLSTGHPFPFPVAPQPVLCQSDAIWGIETWQTGDRRAPFSVQFTGALASRGDLLNVGPGSATVINAVENGVALSSCSTSSTTVTCTFPQP
ncbi:peptidase G1 [Mycena epipterygia]|nr:peptidase G1 [Mycena epipterygia]